MKLAVVAVVAVALATGVARPARADDDDAGPRDPYAEPGAAPAPRDPAAVLAEANAAAVAGDWDRVERLVAGLAPDALARGDRAERHRLAGLAAFFHDRRADAERELLAYLRLDLDARLDPAIVPPEAVTFFEDVRARHGAELRALRPHRRRVFALSFLPPVGQFQNGNRVKGWVLGAGLLALTATNLATYFVLRDWCGNERRLCEPGGSDRASTARTLRTLNIATGVAAIGLYIYGVVDGIRGYRRESARLGIAPTEGGGLMLLSGQF